MSALEIKNGLNIKNILLAYDGSPYSEGALREAIRVAKACKVRKFYVLTVVQTNPELDTIAPSVLEKADTNAKEVLEGVKKTAEKEGINCETLARHGDEPYKVIVNEAEKNGVDTIIMGRKGRTGLKRLVMGSVTARVIGHTRANVLVVPKSASFEFRSLLIATDNSPYSERAALEAVNLAKCSGAKLTVISVAGEPMGALEVAHSRSMRDKMAEEERDYAEAFVKKIQDLAAKEGASAEGVVITGKPYESIVETAKDKNIDLIVIGSHGRSGLEKLLMGSVAEKVIIFSPCAVLVVKK